MKFPLQNKLINQPKIYVERQFMMNMLRYLSIISSLWLHYCMTNFVFLHHNEAFVSNRSISMPECPKKAVISNYWYHILCCTCESSKFYWETYNYNNICMLHFALHYYIIALHMLLTFCFMYFDKVQNS